MTAAARVERASRSLVTGAVAAALLWTVAAWLVWLGAMSGVDIAFGLPRMLRAFALPLGVVIAAAVGWRIWWRRRLARSPEHVALWLEERVPSLRYALVTLINTHRLSPNAAAVLEEQVAGTSWSELLRSRLLRALLIPAAVLALGGMALLLLPRGAVAPTFRPRPGDLLEAVRPGDNRRSVLAPLVAIVTPPAYTGQRTATLEEPTNVTGIVGSDVAIEGRGDASRVRAQLGADSARASQDGARWQVKFRMPATAFAIRLADGLTERLVTIEPRPDSAPVVQLRLPARDSVLRTGTGRLELRAEMSDDIALSSGWFEYIISSGEGGEVFSFRSGVAGRAAFDLVRTGERHAVLLLDSLALKAGDIIHLRAIALDGNNVTGPGRGASETRTIRVARVDEYDSLANLGLPSIIGDTSALSERMLIMLAEALERRRPHLVRDTVVRESGRIAADQARLRRRVADVIFLRVSGENGAEESDADSSRPQTPEAVLEAAESAASRASGQALDFSEDESPVVAINRPLLEAYNAMWDAGRFLEIGEPDDALPHMRAALAAIQRARQAERIYLRGRPPTQVVDLKQVRLSGDRAGSASSRRLALAALGAERARLARRLDAAFARAAISPSDAADSLLLLRIEALGSYPAFAAAASRAAAALRAGRPAIVELIRTRDALLGPPRHAGVLPLWDAAP